ncbi:NAD(P)-dependent dehydrogenase (short-subunit alcohol dehydrogenase family) [Filimonas zeae]|uniref:Short-chain dehydrogenase n=1 Tax=Filimonas zeae TaxID=1737353 RepID=A0A917MTN9_9BACT|nr:SDR family oxidoreductase [Filimonas zeae]MDR6339548.1 NAD(P)-dependent dehydrogenase (short-subunit alcohol dehydrogenase family) [Filimonas zeae]GGH63108.1 short-chain dehydrogenase [Filimonas zeae]
MEQLKGKVAVVTGGNSGIGYATAKELKAQGAEVIITGRRKEALEAAAAALGVTSLVADQGKVADIEALAAAVKQQYGRVDILFINAGVLGGAAIETVTEAEYDHVMNINTKGAFFTLSRFVPLLSEGSSVVFLSSNTATMNKANSAVYSTSKAALNKIMKIAAAELAPRKIRVNAVSPGPTETEILNKMGLGDEKLKELKQWIVSNVPLATMGRAQDVAKMVAHLSGEASAFVTGSEFIMDGGMHL